MASFIKNCAIASLVGVTMPHSVTNPVMSRAGVTSNAGFFAGTPAGGGEAEVGPSGGDHEA